MANDNVRVLTDGYTIHQEVGKLTDPISGTVTGVQQGNGAVYYEGDVVPRNKVSPLLLEALEDEEHPNHEYVSQHIELVSDKPSQNLQARLGLPFAGYDDADEDDIVKAMAVLPSSTVQAIKEYEAAHENRERIATYNIGYGESPVDRQEGRVGSGHQETAEDKTTAKFQTREVPEEGVVTPGEGITGTGDPAVPPGTAAAEEEAPKRGGAGARNRRGRRARPKAEGQGNDGEGDGGSSDE